MLKRSLVMPLPKDTNLLNQVCQGIDWEEAKRLPLCWLQQGAGLWNRITRGQAASERIFITCRGSDTKGRGLEMWLSRGRQGLPCCPRHLQQDLKRRHKIPAAYICSMTRDNEVSYYSSRTGEKMKLFLLKKKKTVKHDRRWITS